MKDDRHVYFFAKLKPAGRTFGGGDLLNVGSGPQSKLAGAVEVEALGPVVGGAPSPPASGAVLAGLLNLTELCFFFSPLRPLLLPAPGAGVTTLKVSPSSANENADTSNEESPSSSSAGVLADGAKLGGVEKIEPLSALAGKLKGVTGPPAGAKPDGREGVVTGTFFSSKGLLNATGGGSDAFTLVFSSGLSRTASKAFLSLWAPRSALSAAAVVAAILGVTLYSRR
mgnify:CR=1 FL=1